VSATIGRDHVIDLVVGNRRPNTVHFNFVVIANDATLGRPTIHQIAARTSVVSSELRVEALMPFIVAHSIVSLLRRRVHTKKQEGPPPRSGMKSQRLMGLPKAKDHGSSIAGQGRASQQKRPPNDRFVEPSAASAI